MVSGWVAEARKGGKGRVDLVDQVDLVDRVVVRGLAAVRYVGEFGGRLRLGFFLERHGPAAAGRRLLRLSGLQAGEAVGSPSLGADAVVDEEKAGGIVFFFDVF